MCLRELYILGLNLEKFFNFFCRSSFVVGSSFCVRFVVHLASRLGSGCTNAKKKWRVFPFIFFYFNLKNLFSYFSPTLICLVLWCCLRCRLSWNPIWSSFQSPLRPTQNMPKSPFFLHQCYQFLLSPQKTYFPRFSQALHSLCVLNMVPVPQNR